MATTAQQAFDKAILLINENNDSTGETDTTNTLEYKVRAIGIINVLLDELYLASDTYTKAATGVRPVATEISLLTDALPIDDALARSVLPYGLAAHFAVKDEPAVASFFQQRYEELLKRFSSALPARSEPVTDVYGVCGYADETYNDYEE